MRTILITFLFLICFIEFTIGQKNVPIDFLEVDNKAILQKGRNSEIDRSLFYKLKSANVLNNGISKERVSLAIPIFKKVVNVELEKVTLLSQDFSVRTAKGAFVTDGSEYTFYRGHIEGKETTSIVSASLRNGDFNMLMSDENGNFQINRFDKQHFVGFYNNELKEQTPFECLTSETAEAVDRRSENRNSPSNECVDIYFEVDYAAYNKKGKSITSTTDWVLALFNQVALQFNRAQVPIKISEILIHTESDPYVNFSGSQNVLYEFRTIRRASGFNGRLAHLLSGRGLGGGIAFLNVLCSNYSNFAVSGNLNGGAVSYPNYSWNVNVIAHELGHNFGSNHTQACVWNGNNTAIDGCAGSEGSCSRPPVPADGGSIMSYCHLNGVGINPLHGFGPQPGALIFDRFSNASCVLSQDCSDVAPVNNICVTAIELIPSQSCINWPYNNINASQSPSSSSFTCGSAADVKDVWFSIKMPSTGDLTIETSSINSGLSDMIMEVYSGDCFNLQHEICDDNSGNGMHAQINLQASEFADEVLYIRVADKESNDEGEFSICAYSSDLPCTIDESIFVDFYSELGGANWTNNQGWAEGAAGQDCDVCQWYGVQCNNQGQVIEINLSDNNLSGSLSNDIDTFQMLSKLNLSFNSITGAIPTDIGQLSALTQLKLNNNLLNQEMPDEIRDLRKLKHLDLSNNLLTGGTAQYLGYNGALEYIDFSNNDLSGCIDQSLYNKCDISFFSLLGNTNLPFAGDITAFCQDYTGSDSDNDGYCKNVNDCDDNNADAFEGNPEVCDGIDNDCNGLVDDGFDNLVNEFLDVNADWTSQANWSLGHEPLACEEVWIGMENEPCEITFPENSYGTRIKALKIGQNSELVIPASSGLELTSLGSIENHGKLMINGSLYCRKTDYSNSFGLRNFGELTITEGSLGFGKQNGTVIINEAIGTITNSGYISMYAHAEDPEVESGIVNYGSIINHNSINIFGSFTGPHIVLKSNSTFTSFIGNQWDEISIGSN